MEIDEKSENKSGFFDAEKSKKSKKKILAHKNQNKNLRSNFFEMIPFENCGQIFEIIFKKFKKL